MIKEKIDPLDPVKMKDCSSKETVNKMKKQARDRERIFTKHVSDKELVTRTLQLNKRTHGLIKKRTDDMNRQELQDDGHTKDA